MHPLSTAGRRIHIAKMLCNAIGPTISIAIIGPILDYGVVDNLGVFLIPIDINPERSNKALKQRRPRLFTCIGRPTSSTPLQDWHGYPLTHLMDPIDPRLVRFNQLTSILLTVHRTRQRTLITFTNVDLLHAKCSIEHPWLPFSIFTYGKWFGFLGKIPVGFSSTVYRITGHLFDPIGRQWIDMQIPITVTDVIAADVVYGRHKNSVAIQLLTGFGIGYEVSIDPFTLDQKTPWNYRNVIQTLPQLPPASSYHFCDDGNLFLSDTKSRTVSRCQFPRNRGDFIRVTLKC